MSTRRLLVAGVAALALAGCTKAADSPTVTGSDANPPVSGSATTLPASSGSGAPIQPTTTTATSSSAATSPPAASSAEKTTAPARTSAPVAAACSAASLSVTVNRGSGVAGHQYATVVFTNTAKTSCPLTGFPGIQLLAGGAPIGSSVRSSAAAATVTLAPGATASSQLVNDSTCGAGESDSVQVIPPNTSTPTVAPLVFRGCTVTVGPVTAG